MQTLATSTGIMPLLSGRFGYFWRILWNINFICSNSTGSHIGSTRKYELLKAGVKKKKKSQVFCSFLTVFFQIRGPHIGTPQCVSSIATFLPAALGVNSLLLLSVVFQNKVEAYYREVTF